MLTKDGYRFHARKLRKNVCEICGTMKNLQSHHRDENLGNNSPENIATLCGSCHTKHHWDNGKKAWRIYEPSCKVCGKPAIRGLCETHRSRLKRHGSPYLVKKKVGSRWLLFEEYGTLNGPMYKEWHPT